MWVSFSFLFDVAVADTCVDRTTCQGRCMNFPDSGDVIHMIEVNTAMISEIGDP